MPSYAHHRIAFRMDDREKEIFDWLFAAYDRDTLNFRAASTTRVIIWAMRQLKMRIEADIAKQEKALQEIRLAKLTPTEKDSIPCTPTSTEQPSAPKSPSTTPRRNPAPRSSSGASKGKKR